MGAGNESSAVMPLQNTYSLQALTLRSRELRAEAAAAPTAEHRSLCLEEAARCDQLVVQSVSIPPVGSDPPRDSHRP